MSLRLLTPCVSMLAFVGVLPVAFAANQPKEQLELQKEGIQLIGQVAEAARDVRYNADRLNMLAKSMTTSKWTHYHHLTEIKTIVNDGLNPAFQRLTQIQPQLPEWKQQSIDNMMVAAKALAADTNSAILSQRDAGAVPTLLNHEYKDLIVKIDQHADNLAKTADAAVAFASAKLKAADSSSAEK